eukprot:CAMPEP_0181249246 /NCGR_PEP_ID=MMETSP1096-20121128/45644_1 /TAXON_ID=156174 ORGANISM="Chrysochromulina ericina, Strain CCMP281" /NCGR_SAMPLE_ID=MMETSP1096 /ASSEMBLY_ACC=CAM_ASM_000453 /LENGTH=124 /DNA_ID=CAMNT_0023346555 /DNA_START=45 /DNA_END=416 /DNA_ORIENTATION=-
MQHTANQPAPARAAAPDLADLPVPAVLQRLSPRMHVHITPIRGAVRFVSRQLKLAVVHIVVAGDASSVGGSVPTQVARRHGEGVGIGLAELGRVEPHDEVGALTARDRFSPVPHPTVIEDRAAA